MERRIRRLGILMVLCFVALFIQLNNIQVFKANSLANNPENPRVLAVERSQPRGSILSSDGVTLAASSQAPPGSVYKYQRVYSGGNALEASLFAQIVGYDSLRYGNYNGVESEYNGYLESHTRPAKTLRDLLVNRTEVDNVTLTVSAKLQAQVAAALDQGAPGVDGAAAVVLNPTTGAVEAMYSNPSFDPNPLVSQNPDVEQFAWDALNAQAGQPLRAGAYNQIYPPGSSFKVVTTSAVLEHAPTLASASYPVVENITLPDTGNPPQILHNYDSEPCGGNLEELLIQSCDADFASIGGLLGAPALVDQAEAYGFNQQIPLDVPSDTVAVSQIGTVAQFATDLPGLMKSAIGQETVSASALQMALVVGTVADGGVEMTPHVMEQIRDSQGNLVENSTPKQWTQPISAQTAATLTTFMQGVVASGTARGVFPPSWDVAAKTGTAEVGADLQNTTDWLIAFAPVGNTKVAIAVVVPNQAAKQTGAGIAGPIVRQILGDVLADQGATPTSTP
ncbi:MAG: penicillin-binding transpeptidase domain-containing protein [Acidimicrobiales bacterium]